MKSDSEIKAFIDSIKSPFQLMTMDRYIKEALIERGISKSKGNAIGEYAEYLAMKALDGTRMRNAKEGHDLTLRFGERVEVKGRVFEGKRVPMNYFSHATISQQTFDYLVYVVFTEKMGVKYAMKISHANFQEIAAYAEPKNDLPKWVFVAKQSLLNDGRVQDITKLIRDAADEQGSN